MANRGGQGDCSNRVVGRDKGVLVANRGKDIFVDFGDGKCRCVLNWKYGLDLPRFTVFMLCTFSIFSGIYGTAHLFVNTVVDLDFSQFSVISFVKD